MKKALAYSWEKLGFDPEFTLADGIAITYKWIEAQVKARY